MTKIGLFFGSDEGNTESIAYRIVQRLGSDVVDVHDVGDVTQLEFLDYDKLILGIPTWDFGQIQSDWEDFLGRCGSDRFFWKNRGIYWSWRSVWLR